MEKSAFSSDRPRILIVRVGAMGDVLHALPAVEALRQALPETHIGWAIEPRWSPLLRAEGATRPDFEQRPLVDAVHLVEAKRWNRKPFSLETSRSILALRHELRAARYDLAIDLQGTVRSAAIARMSGARQVIGGAAPREKIARLFYTRRVSVTATHVADQASGIVSTALSESLDPEIPTHCHPDPELVEGAGPASLPDHHPTVISTGEGQLHRPAERRNLHLLPRDQAAEIWWKEQKQTLCESRQPVLLAATAGWGAKEWPPEKFAALASALVRQGHCVLLNTAPGPVDSVSANVLAFLRSGHPEAAAHVHPLPATVPQLISATREMHAVIAGDTGPLHLAELLGVATVGLFGPTDPVRTGPRHRSICLRDPSSVTDHRRHAQTEAGLARISVDQVLEAFHTVTAP